MCEKLCAILEALRDRGIVCRAECVYCSGVWEIVCEVPFDIGVKVIRYPLKYSFINQHTNDYLVFYMLKVVFAGWPAT